MDKVTMVEIVELLNRLDALERENAELAIELDRLDRENDALAHENEALAFERDHMIAERNRREWNANHGFGPNTIGYYL